MAVATKELIKWLQSIPDKKVHIDEGGLMLCGEKSTAYYEVGGDPREDEEDE